MMFRTKYYYDQETCTYKVYKPSKKKAFFIFAITLVGVLLSSSVAFELYANWKSGQRRISLSIENDKLLEQIEDYNSRLKDLSVSMSSFQSSEMNHYRVVVCDSTQTRPQFYFGVGGSEDESLKDLKYPELAELYFLVDSLKQEMYTQSKAFEQLTQITLDRDKMQKSFPGLFPVNSFVDDSYISSKYGMRFHKIHKKRMMHQGIDFAGPKGTPIYATGAGIVKGARYSSSYGNVVEIDHGFDYKTKYAHMTKFIVKEGESVKRGQVIGYIGSTGSSTGPHCHYEIHYKNRPVDPETCFVHDLNEFDFCQVTYDVCDHSH